MAMAQAQERAWARACWRASCSRPVPTIAAQTTEQKPITSKASTYAAPRRREVARWTPRTNETLMQPPAMDVMASVEEEPFPGEHRVVEELTPRHGARGSTQGPEAAHVGGGQPIDVGPVALGRRVRSSTAEAHEPRRPFHVPEPLAPRLSPVVVVVELRLRQGAPPEQRGRAAEEHPPRRSIPARSAGSPGGRGDAGLGIACADHSLCGRELAGDRHRADLETFAPERHPFGHAVRLTSSAPLQGLHPVEGLLATRLEDFATEEMCDLFVLDDDPLPLHPDLRGGLVVLGAQGLDAPPLPRRERLQVPVRTDGSVRATGGEGLLDEPGRTSRHPRRDPPRSRAERVLDLHRLSLEPKARRRNARPRVTLPAGLSSEASVGSPRRTVLRGTTMPIWTGLRGLELPARQLTHRDGSVGPARLLLTLLGGAAPRQRHPLAPLVDGRRAPPSSTEERRRRRGQRAGRAPQRPGDGSEPRSIQGPQGEPRDRLSGARAEDVEAIRLDRQA